MLVDISYPPSYLSPYRPKLTHLLSAVQVGRLEVCEIGIGLFTVVFYMLDSGFQKYCASFQKYVHRLVLALHLKIRIAKYVSATQPPTAAGYLSKTDALHLKKKIEARWEELGVETLFQDVRDTVSSSFFPLPALLLHKREADSWHAASS